MNLLKFKSHIVDVTGGDGGKAYLILGEKKTALMDAGMAYCAANMIENIQQVLQNRELNYILISHSHYDHIGGVPYVKQEWPDSRVLGAKYAEQVLMRPNALKTIRSLSRQAAEIYGATDLKEYADELLKVDDVIYDGDRIDLGNLNIEVIETKGHTQCSLSFLVNREVLFASESTGCMERLGTICPAFVTSALEAINSIRICKEISPRFIISPHYGLVNERNMSDYWQECLRSIQKSIAFILHLFQKGYDEGQILTEYEKAFWNEQVKSEQPLNAFKLNTRSMIKTVLREYHG